MTDSIAKSNVVNLSEGVNGSYGVNVSKGVNLSEGVNDSDGVNVSDGVNLSKGVNLSDGVSGSNGVNGSKGVNDSDGVNRAYGVFNSFGVNNWIFCANKKQQWHLFNTEVSKHRFNEVWEELHNKLNNWFPKFNNAFELYFESGNTWSKVKANDICLTLSNNSKPYEAWKDMPTEAIDYLKSLPEFNAEVFKAVTGIDVKTSNDTTQDDEIIELNGKRYKLIKD